VRADSDMRFHTFSCSGMIDRSCDVAYQHNICPTRGKVEWREELRTKEIEREKGKMTR
jgi:hypothetical protein